MSGSSNTIPGTIHAAARVTMGPPTLRAVRGCGALAVIGTGVFDLTFDQPIDALESALIGSINDALGGEIILQQTSDDTIRVSTFTSAGAAADRGFSIVVLRP